MSVVVTTLEVLVCLDHEVHLGANVGLQNGGSDRRMVGHADRLADVVTQRGNDHLVVGPRALGHGRRLERMRELVGDEAVLDVAK